jgi:hypothetical protein
VTTDELDRILSSADSLEPSAGFTAAVMGTVRERAAEPPPLPFPWGRFAAGLAACVLLAASGSLLLLRLESPLGALAAPLSAVAPELGYAALALLASGVTARLPRALVRR